MHEIRNVVEDEEKLIENLEEQIEFLSKSEFDFEKKFELLVYFIKTQHKIQSVCKKSKNFAR